MKLQVLALAAALFCGGVADATVIKFDSGPDDGQRMESYSEGGYNFTRYAGTLDFYDAGYGVNRTGLQSVFNISREEAAATGIETMEFDPFKIKGARTIPSGTVSVLDDLKFGGGVVAVKAENGGIFNFESVDYSWFSLALPNTVGIMTFTAYRGGSQVGIQHFGRAGTRGVPYFYSPGYAVQPADFGPTARGFYNDSLGGVAMDELRITLPAGFFHGFPGLAMSIDNLVLNSVPTAVPEPATWLMMIVGFGFVGFSTRRRKSVVAQVPAT